MRRILFVDDEDVVLESLRSMLRKHRHEWEMTFASDGEAALLELQRAPFDVVVTDMRMPRVDGATLLRRVVEDHPQVVRIVLSGRTELEASRRAVHVAHQFLAKPCDSAELKRVVERACQLRTLLEQPTLRQAVGAMGQLPMKPNVYGRLVEVLERLSSSIDDTVVLIERDTAIAAKLLQLVNSAFFGIGRRITDLKSAVSYLGIDIVKILVLDIGLRQTEARACPGFNLEAIQEHGLLTARIARRLVDDKIQAQDAFSAAMLKDAGCLVLLSREQEKFQAAVALARSRSCSLGEVEIETFGVSHAEVGAYLLGIWGLPYAIVEAVVHHHDPMRAGSTTFDVVGAVHVAGALAEECVPTESAKGVGSGSRLDMGYLEHLGVQNQLAVWRAIAAKEAAQLTRS